MNRPDPEACRRRRRNTAIAAILMFLLAPGCSSSNSVLRGAGLSHRGAPDVNVVPATGGCVTAGCHEGMEKSRLPHSPVRERRCGACHVGRASSHPGDPGPEFGLKADRLEDLCFSCHGSLAGEIRSATVRHAPVARGRCGACHDPHGTGFPALLKEVVWANEWESPSPGPRVDVRKLCWECHDRRMLDENDARGTRFRDGDRNLHHLHAGGRPKERGCKACHETHAGRQPALVRESVPFGTAGWRLPVRFSPMPDGGSCVVGCHRPQEYRR